MVNAIEDRTEAWPDYNRIEVKTVNKPLHVKVNDRRTTAMDSESGKTGSFKSSVPANGVRPRPVIVPISKSK